MTRIEVHQKVGADAGEAAVVADGAVGRPLEDPEAVAVRRRALLGVCAPHFPEHRLRDELARTKRDVESEETLDGCAAAPRRARHVSAMGTTGPVFANISRSTANGTLGYNHKPTGEA